VVKLALDGINKNNTQFNTMRLLTLLTSGMAMFSTIVSGSLIPLRSRPDMSSIAEQQKQQPYCNVLALSGGGSFGAVQMGVLDGLVSNGVAPAGYDIITGISAGGLNAGFLSYFTRVDDALPSISSIYANLTTADIYTSDILHIFSNYAVYSTAPLHSTLAGIVGTQTQQSPAPITLIGSTNVNRQTLDVFQYNLADYAEKIQLLMATSAIPFVFPPQTLNGDLYVDGGVISNEMIQQALSAKDCGFYNFTFISASPVHQTVNVTGFGSYISAIGGLLLNTFDYQLAEYESIVCSNTPRGQINACFPTSPAIEQYSILDFNYGATLYELGKSAFSCNQYNFC
jgi:predicted acylesterase/phospholipase RssA